jgi:DNA polymerase-3 subunit delta'
MTTPDPRENPLLFGHHAAEQILADTMQSGRMHHAWLISGPEGIGKATLAYRFARRLLAGKPEPGRGLALDPQHPVFRRVAAGTHADLFSLEREWDEKRKRFRSVIQAEPTREIAKFMHLTPAEAGWRVVVVDGAEEMNPAAANAVLKILEEPPPRAVLLLVTSAVGRLLPTIRSRCRRLQLSPLAEADMAIGLAQYLPDTAPEQRQRLAVLAEGSIGRALVLAEGGGLGLAGLVDDVLGADSIDVTRAHAVADALGREDEAFSTFMDLLRAGISSAVRDAARGRADPDQSRMIGSRPLDAWVEVWHALTRLQNETEHAYLDKRQAIVTGLSLLAGAR